MRAFGAGGAGKSASWVQVEQKRFYVGCFHQRVATAGLLSGFLAQHGTQRAASRQYKHDGIRHDPRFGRPAWSSSNQRKLGDWEAFGMSGAASPSVVRPLGVLFDVGSVAGLSDGQLLERFLAGRDPAGEAAFAALVARHGPLVLGVCQQLLGDRHHAEDAFQAVFLVLARKAPALREPELLGNWLYGVALRTARKARCRLAHQRRCEDRATLGRPEAHHAASAEQVMLDREQAEAIHREVERLPGAFRAAVVLCYLEGLSPDEAAHRLRWPAGTVRSRLVRARTKLRRGLALRGLALPSAALAAASMPTRLIGSTAHAATLYTAGGVATAGMVSANVAALTREVLRTMLLSKIKVATAVLLVATAVAAFGHVLNRRLWAQDPETAPPPAASTIGRPPVGDEKLFQGAWDVILMEKDGVEVTKELKGVEFRENNNLFMRWLKDQGPTPSDNPPNTFFHLDQSARPKGISIDWNLPQPERGIYTLAGDILIICLDEGIGQDRPTTFSARTGSGRTLIVLKKQP